MLKHLDLFSGIGGFTVAASRVGGIVTTQFVEIDPDAQSILRTHFPGVPIHSDILNYHPSYGSEDLYTIGFPCTGTSNAGKRTGLAHFASALWREGLRCICLGRPRFVVVEQPEGFIRRGLRAVLGGLRMAGYLWDDPQLISAKELGSHQQRPRVFVVAYSNQLQWSQQPTCWTDQVRDVVQGQRTISRWPAFKCTNDGTVAEFPPGLVPVPVGVPKGTPGRIRARYLAGRTVTPAQAAIALQRVLYLNSLISTNQGASHDSTIRKTSRPRR